MRFRLRTLMILLAVLPPLIAYQYHRSSDLSLWQRLADAKQERDTALVEWRRVYDAVQSGKALESEEVAVQGRYYKGREKTESAYERLIKRYGGEKQLIEAMQVWQKKK